MNCKPDTTPRFAVNRAAMLSRLPGVQLSASAKRFARGRPKLLVSEPLADWPVSTAAAARSFTPRRKRLD